MSLIERKQQAQQVQSEIDALIDYLAIKCPKVVAECGSAQGGTLAYFAQLKTVQTLITLDLPMGIHGGQGYENRKNLLEDFYSYCNEHKVEFFNIDGDSKDKKSIDTLSAFLNGRYVDAFMIDGDHTYDGVLSDFLNYAPFCKDGSVIIFHDVRNSEWHHSVGAYVDVLWAEIKEHFSETKEFIAENVEECFVKIPESSPHGFGGIGVLHYSEKEFKEFKRKKELYNSNAIFLSDRPLVPVSVVIGTCGDDNGLLNNCIESILRESVGNSFMCDEIVVVVNGIDEATFRSSLYNFDDLQVSTIVKIVYASDTMLGFSGAYNRGIRESKNEHVVILNSDTVIHTSDEHWLDRLFMPFVDKHNVGIVAVATKKEDKTALGFCLGTTKTVLNTVGLLNEGYYPGYYEDNDFTVRVRNAGYSVIGLNEISFSDENRFLNFPIHHVGMQTLSNKFNNEVLNNFIQEHKKKFEYYESNKHNIRYCIIAHTPEYLEDVLFTHPIYIDDTTLILVIQLFDGFQAEDKNYDKIHVIKPLKKDASTEEIRNIAKAFFGTESYLVVHDAVIENESLTWCTNFSDQNSMGILSTNIVENVPKEFDIHVKGILGESNTKNKYIQQLLKREPGKNGIGIMFSYPHSYGELNGFDLKIIYTGSDTKYGIPNFGECANKADILFTPSYLSKQFMLNCDVEKPVFVLPHGVNVDIFKPVHKKYDLNAEVFNFINIGEQSDRKGTYQLLDAFKKLINRKYKCKLILKSNLDLVGMHSQKLKDYIKQLNLEPYVELIENNEGQEYVYELMKKAHCMVYPSRADSFAMTPLEALATGMPVITHEKLGVVDFVKEYLILGKAYETQIKDHPLYVKGSKEHIWYEMNPNQLMKQMIDVMENYDKYNEQAKQGSEFVHANFSWKNIVEDFVPTLKMLSLNKKKKTITVYVTSYNKPEYLYKTLDSIIEKKRFDKEYEYKICVFEQSPDRIVQDNIYRTIKDKYKNEIAEIYCSPFNLGLRGAINKAYGLGWFDNADYIMITDQDNLFHTPLSLYAKVLNKYKSCIVATGYLSKEHEVHDVIYDNEFGNIIIKSTARGGMMFYRAQDLVKLLPMNLDVMHGWEGNSSWNIGLDWSLLSWLPDSPLAQGLSNFIYCIPNSTTHFGYDSSWRETDESMINREEIMQDEQYVIGNELNKNKVLEMNKLI